MTPGPRPECGETAGHLPACRAEALDSLRKAAAYAIADVDGGTSLVEHADNVLALLDECAALRSQLAEAQGESLAYQAQLDAAREALPPDLLAANDGYVHEAIAHLWRGFSTERGTLDGVLGERDSLRARVAELEAQHDNAGDLFASGRRYERAWAGLRAPALDGLIADLKQQLDWRSAECRSAWKRVRDLEEDAAYAARWRRMYYEEARELCALKRVIEVVRAALPPSPSPAEVDA